MARDTVGSLAVAVLLVTTVMTTTVAGVGTAQRPLVEQEIDPDTVTLQASIQPDGDAAWAVIYRVRLDDDNETAAFEEYQAAIRNDTDSYTGEFRTRMSRTAATAANATGREMAIENVTVETEITALPQKYGVVTYRFRWTNFAAVSGDRIRAGDALDGLFLDGETVLRMRFPAGYRVTEVTPKPDEQSDREVIWRGAQDFGPGEPRLILAEGTAPSASPSAESPSPPTGTGGTGLLAGGVLAVAAVVATVLAVRRYGWPGSATADSDDGDDGGTGGAARSDSETDAGSDGSEDAPATPPEELLSNEEQVLKLLADNGGRMKQKEVADRLDWTAAKTSQVVGDLRDEGEVEAFRLGRENVLTLPDVDIDGGGEDGT
ncbi:MAG: helix-turn-helix transcriptional regulator [Haloarculaceae archaeon]